MKLKFYNVPHPRMIGPKITATSDPVRTEFVEANVRLYPLQPVVDLAKAELNDGSRTQVLHVKVIDEKGRDAHIHFSVGLNNRGQVVGEVCALGDRKDVIRKVVGHWFNPRSAEGLRLPTLDDPDTAAEYAEEKHVGFDD